MDAVYLLTPIENSVLKLIKDFEIPNEKMYRAAHIFFTEGIILMFYAIFNCIGYGFMQNFFKI